MSFQPNFLMAKVTVDPSATNRPQYLENVVGGPNCYIKQKLKTAGVVFLFFDLRAVPLANFAFYPDQQCITPHIPAVNLY